MEVFYFVNLISGHQVAILVSVVLRIIFGQFECFLVLEQLNLRLVQIKVFKIWLRHIVFEFVALEWRLFQIVLD